MYTDQKFDNDREVLFTYAKMLRAGHKTLKDCVRSFASMLFHKYILCGTGHEFMFINTVSRQDHGDFFQQVYEQCDYDKDRLKWESRKRFNIHALRSFVRFLPHMSELKQLQIPKLSRNAEGPDGDGYQKVGSLQMFILYCNLIKNLEMKRSIAEFDWGKTKIVVALYDIGEPEHFVVNRANELGLKTVVLQHGIMLPYFDYKDVDTYNIYKVPSKYFLALGKSMIPFTKRMVSDTQVIVCGQLKIKENNHHEADKYIIGIAASIPNDREENIRMIYIIEEYARKNGKKVYIRLHPSDKETNYKLDNNISKFERNIEDAAIIVAYRTTMIFTYMAMGKCVMRYDGGTPYFNLPDKIVFHNYKEFEKKVSDIGETNFKAIVSDHIECIGEEAAAKYKAAFRTIREAKE